MKHIDNAGGDREKAAPPPLAHTIDDTVRLSRCSRTIVFAEIKSGALKARKLGRRTLILDDDLRAWLNALPTRAA